MRAVALERMPTCLSAGQAERLACRWQPNAFCGLAPAPTLDGPRAEEQREERRIRPMPELRCRWQREHRPPEVRENRPVCPCEPLCRANRGGRHPCQPKQVCCPCRRCVAEVGDDCWNAFPPESRVNLPVESIAGESPDAFLAPGRSQLPAVRAVAGF